MARYSTEIKDFDVTNLIIIIKIYKWQTIMVSTIIIIMVSQISIA